MSILHDIQNDIISNDPRSLSNCLLKLNFLGRKLNIQNLEDWVANESKGYSKDVDLPEYRKFPLSFSGDFTGSFNSSMTNYPIPRETVARLAGKDSIFYEARQSIAELEYLINDENNNGGILIVDMSNLIFPLDNQVFHNMNCIRVEAKMSISNVVGLLDQIRHKVLTLAIGLEEKVPESAKITIGKNNIITDIDKNKAIEVVNVNLHQSFGNLDNSNVTMQFSSNINIIPQDDTSFIQYLQSLGLPEDEANTFLTETKKGNANNHNEASTWIKKNVPRLCNVIGNISTDVLTTLLTGAISKHYGI